MTLPSMGTTVGGMTVVVAPGSSRWAARARRDESSWCRHAHVRRGCPALPRPVSGTTLQGPDREPVAVLDRKDHVVERIRDHLVRIPRPVGGRPSVLTRRAFRAVATRRAGSSRGWPRVVGVSATRASVVRASGRLADTGPERVRPDPVPAIVGVKEVGGELRGHRRPTLTTQRLVQRHDAQPVLAR